MMKNLLLTLSLSLLALPIQADELTPSTRGSEDLPPPRMAPPKPVAAPPGPAPAVSAPAPAPMTPRVEAVKAAPAPLPAPVPPARKTFGGFYAGASLGYLFANTDVYIDTGSGGATIYDFKGMGGEGPSVGLHGGWGTMFGQQGKGYAGIELGYQFNSGVDSSHQTNGFPRIGLDVEDSWILSGRLGYLFEPQTMVYGRAGLVRTKFSLSYAGVPAFAGDDHANGVILGLGVEHRLNENWTVRGEYAYLNHEDMDFNLLNGNADVVQVENNSGLFHVGLSYTF